MKFSEYKKQRELSEINWGGIAKGAGGLIGKGLKGALNLGKGAVSGLANAALGTGGQQQQGYDYSGPSGGYDYSGGMMQPQMMGYMMPQMGYGMPMMMPQNYLQQPNFGTGTQNQQPSAMDMSKLGAPAMDTSKLSSTGTPTPGTTPPVAGTPIPGAMDTSKLSSTGTPAPAGTPPVAPGTAPRPSTAPVQRSGKKYPRRR